MIKDYAMEYMIQTNGITKRYGKHKVLDNVSMHVPKGSIYGFVGKNGAGKTTLMRIISALNAPTSGTYSLNLTDYKNTKINEVRRKIGAVVETPSIYLDMTAKQNLLLQYKIHGIKPDGLQDLLNLVGLPDTGKKKAKNFSLGMRQRLSIAFSLISDPELLILDEPINGLDPEGIKDVRELLYKLNTERGITILISSHILDELSKLATHYGFIDGGRMIKEMSADELENSCRHSIKLTVNNTALLSEALDAMKLDYSVKSETEAEIYSQINVTPLVLALNEKGCEVITMTQNTDNLEDYFMELIGGGENA